VSKHLSRPHRDICRSSYRCTALEMKLYCLDTTMHRVEMSMRITFLLEFIVGLWRDRPYAMLDSYGVEVAKSRIHDNIVKSTFNVNEPLPPRLCRVVADH
jgi:hypothetical protein